ncbi:MAG: DUF885 family protein [Eubacteriales bacterium]|nr:DUF885 family protein [Eubacteriales bacterium]
MSKYVLKLISILLCVILLVGSLACHEKVRDDLGISDSTAEQHSAQPSDTNIYSTPSVVSDAERFDQIDREMFIWYVTQDATYLHQAIKDPSAYNIDVSLVPNTLGDYSQEHSLSSIITLQGFLSQLNEINPDELNEDHSFAYSVIKQYLELQIQYEEVYIYREPLDLYVGIQANLPIFFELFRLETKEDVELYLELLADVPRYLEQILEHERQRANMGIYMTEDALDRILSDLYSIVSSAENCFLIPSFEETISDIEDISQVEIEVYCARQQELVVNSYLGGFENLYLGLSELRQYCRQSAGIINQDSSARKYFEVMLKIDSSSNLLVNEARELLESQVEDMQLMIATIYAQDPTVFEYPSRITTGTVESDALYLRSIADNFLPSCPDVDVKYAVIPNEQQNTFSPAAYLVPPLDCWQDNTILLNPKYESDLFVLAHEGYVGHMYQHTYQGSIGNASLFVQVMEPIGYVEGWAMNAELYTAMYSEQIGTNYCQSVCADDNMFILLGAISSILVNYYDFSFEQLTEYLDKYSCSTYANYMYTNSINMPTYYFKYALGFCNQIAISNECESISVYDLVEYHKAYLDLGPAYFNLIKPKMLEWAAKNGS